MRIPLEPGDRVVSMVYRPDQQYGTTFLVVTEQGHMYEIHYSGREYEVRVL